MSETEKAAPSSKPKGMIVDRKFKPEDLKIPRNQVYVRDLGQCFKIFQKWGYDIIWVESGLDAMRALREYHDDIKSIILEVYIAGGGFSVARMIRFKPDCKHIPVFLMSSQLTEKDLEEGKRIGVFDSLARPFQDLDHLEGRLVKARDESAATAEAEADGPPVDPKDHITQELEKITNLPAMPTVYNEIEKLSQDSDSTTEQYSNVIEVDPGITTQLLKLCNSSAFSFSRRITSVNDAVNLLGLQTVIDFVRTLSVVGAFKGGAAGFDLQEFWQHSIGCGTAAKLLLDRDEVKGKLDLGADDPFMSGMVHDIGKQVLGFFFNDLFGMVIEEIRTKNATMYEVEKDVLGISHTDIGAALAGKWQLPDFLTSVIGGHQDPSGQDTTPAMTHLIHFSNACANTIGFSFIQKPTEPTIDPKTLELLGMENEAAAALFKELEPTVRSQVTDTFSAIFS